VIDSPCKSFDVVFSKIHHDIVTNIVVESGLQFISSVNITDIILQGLEENSLFNIKAHSFNSNINNLLYYEQ
jgi:hypothetical protein